MVGNLEISQYIVIQLTGIHIEINIARISLADRHCPNLER